MIFHVSWDIDIDDAASPLDAAQKAHAIVRWPGTSANVYNVEAPNGVVIVVDLEVANGPTAPDPAPSLQEVLAAAESFISGFEGDELQEGVDQLLAGIRAALRGRTDRQIVDETNALAGYIMAALIGTGYQVADAWRFYEETDPRSRKAWKHAVAIMEMITFTNADEARSNLGSDEADSKCRFPAEELKQVWSPPTAPVPVDGDHKTRGRGEGIAKSEARLTLNVFGPGGEATGEMKTVSISPDGLADIVDHATQLLILENMERRTSGVLAELRDALEVYGLLPPAP